MNEIEQKIRTMFPRGSKSFFNANAGLRSEKRQQNRVRPLGGEISGETKSDARPGVSIVLFRVRLLDKENAYTATKSLTDCLCQVGLLPGDAEGEINLTVSQEKVSHRNEQKTVVHIEYP